MIQKAKNYYHFLQSAAAGTVYGFPAKKLKVIGVTGTDGKTTTANLIYHLLNEKGYKVAVISTVGAFVNGKLYETGLHVTTPSGFSLQKMIRKITKEGCSYLVLEITSHALDQMRVFGIPIEIAVLTNITHEHLDYHKTFETYRDAKFKLFKGARISVLNQDDSSFELFRKRLSGKTVYSYSLISNTASITPQKMGIEDRNFNTSNRMAAVMTAHIITGLPFGEFLKSLETFQLPEGRQEFIYLDAFAVMVDFAHTPFAFLSILQNLKQGAHGRIIHVFGSAGERDRTKRPLMGEASSNYADVIILTSEDPRHEDPLKIADEIAGGFADSFQLSENLSKTSKKEYSIILDRKEAIKKAIEIAQEGDLVLITGKGHEKSMNIKGVEYPWSDKATALSFL